MAQSVENVRASVEGHRREIEQCLRSSNPSPGFVAEGMILLPGGDLPNSLKRSLGVLSEGATMQSFERCMQAEVQSWGIPDQSTSPSLRVALHLQANWSSPALSKWQIPFTPLLSLEEGRVLVSYAVGYYAAPKKLSGRPLEYTREAMNKNVKGVIVARCLLERTGRVRNCQALQKVPVMTAPTLANLESSTYDPARWNGEPFDMTFTFVFKLWTN
jgi:hypothetical protein